MDGRQLRPQPRQDQAAKSLCAFPDHSMEDCLVATDNEMFVYVDCPHEFRASNKVSRLSSAWSLIQLAADCSEAAYDDHASYTAQPHDALKRIKISHRYTSLHGPIVVVAASGTRGLRDWMVNLNNGASEPNGVLVSSHVDRLHGYGLITCRPQSGTCATLGSWRLSDC